MSGISRLFHLFSTNSTVNKKLQSQERSLMVTYYVHVHGNDIVGEEVDTFFCTLHAESCA